MRTVNPLHIGALLLVIIAFLFFKLSSAKSELNDAQTSFRESQKLALKLSALQSLYAEKEKRKDELKRVLKNALLKDVNLNVVDKKGYTLISAKTINVRALNFLMSKILNGVFKIEKLNIVKLNDKEAHLEMEIKW